MNTFGPTYNQQLDQKRIMSQMNRVRRELEKAAARGEWLTVQQLSARTAAPECSVSAQIRHLRKPQYGNYTITYRRRKGEEHLGTSEYLMRIKHPGQEQLPLCQQTV